MICAENGLKYYKNFAPGDYDHFPQNWQIAQDKNGIIYVANQAGLLEYDGEKWQIIEVPGYDPVRSMAIDEAGTIYLGGTNDIGYLKKEDNGVLQFVSLLEYIDLENRKFNNVWKTVAFKDDIYFRTNKYLFRWDKKNISQWRVDTKITNIFECRGKFYIHVEGLGLATLKDDKITVINGGELFSKNKVRLMVPFDKNHVMLYADNLGFFIYNSRTFSTYKVHKEIKEYIDGNLISY